MASNETWHSLPANEYRALPARGVARAPSPVAFAATAFLTRLIHGRGSMRRLRLEAEATHSLEANATGYPGSGWITGRIFAKAAADRAPIVFSG
jgi:hypothetical protein